MEKKEGMEPGQEGMEKKTREKGGEGRRRKKEGGGRKREREWCLGCVHPFTQQACAAPPAGHCSRDPREGRGGWWENEGPRSGLWVSRVRGHGSS